MKKAFLSNEMGSEVEGRKEEEKVIEDSKEERRCEGWKRFFRIAKQTERPEMQSGWKEGR